jgi:hypothetical protein
MRACLVGAMISGFWLDCTVHWKQCIEEGVLACVVVAMNGTCSSVGCCVHHVLACMPHMKSLTWHFLPPPP